MTFNSIEFATFLPIVYVLYWFITNDKIELQNLLLLIASYVFYGWWDWRFLSLIIISSVTDYTIGLKLEKSNSNKKRKQLLYCSLFVNLGLLGFFKYYNFFTESFIDAFAQAGVRLHERTLNIILPVGISFYTFQTLSYTIDIYNKRLKPTKDIIAFFSFVSFFPQLVAGPIERAKNLLPQFKNKRIFNYENTIDGLRQILWGLFKKVVIADTCAIYVDTIFANYNHLSGSILLIGAVSFAFQIYCDFSGYSDIAIGTAKLFGFNLMTNFSLPYFSKSIGEFWRRWHISLSTWFRDYLYIPLGGNRGNKLQQTRNVLITFTLSGLWHGADWRFVFWGFLNGLFYLPTILSNKYKQKDITEKNKILLSLNKVFQIVTTFFLILLTWVFFRAENYKEAIHYLNNMFSKSLLYFPEYGMKSLIWISVLIIFEWLQRKKQHPMQIQNIPIFFRWISYYIISFLIVWHVNFFEATTFIYFQF